MQLKYFAVAAALLAAVAAGAADTAFSGSGSEGSESPVPTADNMKVWAQKPDASFFTHYYFTDASMTQMRRSATKRSTYNPVMEFGGASIANREDGMGKAGWDMTYVSTETAFTEANTNMAFYAAGFAEGAETQHRIYQNFMNIFPNTTTLSWNVQCNATCVQFIEHQRTYIKNTSLSVVANPDIKTDSMEYKFWSSVQQSVQQIQGMIDGYHSAVDPASVEYLSDMQIFLVGFDFELSDVQHWAYAEDKKAGKVPATPAASGVQIPRAAGRNSHCSALIKVTADDLFMAHDTWSGYNTMLRQYKTYEFGNSSIPTIAMSSYPGTLHSGDDWYMMSNGLTTQETTNGNFNTTSQPLISPESVPEFVRVMVANRVAVDGQSWTELFSMQNSGTYNNQYMVVNHNLFNPNGKTAAEKTPAGTLWIVEQMPQLMKRADVTGWLVNQSYWASYNIPYLLNSQMDYPKAVQKYGSFFNYTTYARPEIFRANQGAIKDLDGMKMMMRWNEYKTSPLSLIPMDNCRKTTSGKCTPANSPTLAIANRADLANVLTKEEGGPIYKYLTQAAFGAIDTKITSYTNMKKGMMGHMISGPSALKYSGSDNLPVFAWSTSPSVFSGVANQHLGMPDKYDFEFYSSEELVGDKIYHKSIVPEATDVNDRYHGKFAPYQGFMLGVLLAILGLAGYIYFTKTTSEEEYNPMAN